MEGDLKRNETVSPMAGKTPSQEMLVDVTRLEREYFEHLPDVEDPTQLVSFGTSGLEVVSHVIDPTFRFMTVDWEGQIRMDPSSVYAMASMVGLKQRFDVAIASDTDADRHGIVSRSHGLLDPNHLLSVAISYLFANRPQWSQAVAVGKTVVSSSMIDRLVNKLGLYKIYAESFKDQGHLDAIVSEAQEIVNDALKSFDSAYQQREVR